jgi:hypothetical protein
MRCLLFGAMKLSRNNIQCKTVDLNSNFIKKIGSGTMSSVIYECSCRDCNGNMRGRIRTVAKKIRKSFIN